MDSPLNSRTSHGLCVKQCLGWRASLVDTIRPAPRSSSRVGSMGLGNPTLIKRREGAASSSVVESCQHHNQREVGDKQVTVTLRGQAAGAVLGGAACPMPKYSSASGYGM